MGSEVIPGSSCKRVREKPLRAVERVVVSSVSFEHCFPFSPSLGVRCSPFFGPSSQRQNVDSWMPSALMMSPLERPSALR